MPLRFCSITYAVLVTYDTSLMLWRVNIGCPHNNLFTTLKFLHRHLGYAWHDIGDIIFERCWFAKNCIIFKHAFFMIWIIKNTIEYIWRGLKYRIQLNESAWRYHYDMSSWRFIGQFYSVLYSIQHFRIFVFNSRTEVATKMITIYHYVEHSLTAIKPHRNLPREIRTSDGCIKWIAFTSFSFKLSRLLETT